MKINMLCYRFYSALYMASYHECIKRTCLRSGAYCLPDFVDLVIFHFYTIGSLHRVFYFENWLDTLCRSCVSDFLLARSAPCSLLQLLSKINQAAESQSCPACLDSTVRRS